MLREEEIIKQLSIIKDKSDCIGHYAMISSGVNYFRTGFEVGVQWADENPKSPWVSVKDKLPEEYKYESDTMQGHKEWTESEGVFVMNNKGVALVDILFNGKWRSIERCPFDCDGFPNEITHWMPIPKLPEED